MWSREEPRKDTGTNQQTVVTGSRERPPDKAQEIAANIGRSVRIKGHLSGSEDLTVDGQLEGRIELPDHALTIGPNAEIKADIVARVVTIFGSVVGSVTARDKAEIRRSGSLQGNLAGRRIAIQEGAHFCGKVTMERGRDDKPEPQKVSVPDLVAVKFATA